MDLHGKQSFLPGDCPICPKMKAVAADKCQECGKSSHVSDVVPVGYDSPTADHFHVSSVKGVAGYTVIKKRLCKKCYLKARKEAYPDEPPLKM